MSFGIVIDSSADLHPSLDEDIIVVENGIIINGKEKIEGKDITRNEFIEYLNQGGLATTSQATPTRFKEAYERATAEYDDVLSIHVGSKLSGVLNNAYMSSRKFKDKIHFYDSGTVSIGITYLIHLAQRMRKEGMTVEQAIQAMESVKDKIFIRVICQNVDYLSKSGRVTGTKFYAAKLLGLKPIMAVEKGLVIQSGVGVGIKRTLKRIIKDFSRAFNPESEPFIITGNVQKNEYYEDFKQTILNMYNPKEFYETGLSGLIIAHLGPFALGALFAPSIERTIENYL